MKNTGLRKMGVRILLLVAVVIAGFAIRSSLDRVYQRQKTGIGTGTVTEYEDGQRVGRELVYAEDVPRDNSICQAFAQAHPEAEILLACEEDVTDDGLKDLVVIYATTETDEHVDQNYIGKHKHIRLSVAIDSGDGEQYQFTDPVPAPVDNQKIQFQNIDKKDEIEFVLQGQKDNQVGYGIYRVMDGATVNLYGEGMEEC